MSCTFIISIVRRFATNISVRCTFNIYRIHSSTNITVRCTFDIFRIHSFTNISVRCTFNIPDK
jgi:hypothetical protein